MKRTNITKNNIKLLLFTLYVHSLYASKLPALACGADRTINPVSIVHVYVRYQGRPQDFAGGGQELLRGFGGMYP